MYLCQILAGLSLQEIADSFGIVPRGVVSNALTEVRKLKSMESQFEKEIESLIEMIQSTCPLFFSYFFLLKASKSPASDQ